MIDRDEELQKAYNDLNLAETKLAVLERVLNEKHKVQQILIAAGFLTIEKINEAEAIIETIKS